VLRETQPYLSIPLWCDCHPAASSQPEPQPCPFNPTMVRLPRGQVGALFAAYKRFQSHYGAIATGPLPWVAASGDGLSIPLWCDCNQNRLKG